MPDPHDEVETRVLNAALELLLRYGFAKTGMENIASAAHIAKSTLYTRWKNKEALYTDLLWRESKKTLENWFARIEADPQGGALKAIYGHALAEVRENPLWRMIYRQDRTLLGNYLERLGMADFMQRRFQMNMGLLVQLQAAGLVRQDVDPRMMAYASAILQVGFLRIDEFIPAEAAPPGDETLVVLIEMIEQWLSPPNEVDQEAGKRIIRDFMAQARQQMALMETQMQAAKASRKLVKAAKDEES